MGGPAHQKGGPCPTQNEYAPGSGSQMEDSIWDVRGDVFGCECRILEGFCLMVLLGWIGIVIRGCNSEIEVLGFGNYLIFHRGDVMLFMK